MVGLNERWRTALVFLAGAAVGSLAMACGLLFNWSRSHGVLIGAECTAFTSRAFRDELSATDDLLGESPSDYACRCKCGSDTYFYEDRTGGYKMEVWREAPQTPFVKPEGKDFFTRKLPGRDALVFASLMSDTWDYCESTTNFLRYGSLPAFPQGCPCAVLGSNAPCTFPSWLPGGSNGIGAFGY